MPEEETATSTDNSTRGRPYYEKLRTDLKGILEKKRELDKNMAAIEASIARAENQYLEETSAAGNIIKGFDNYIKASGTTGANTSTGGGTATRRRGGVSDQDRIFSRSSVSWKKESPTPLITNGNNSATPSERNTPAGPSAGARETGVSAGGNTNKAGNKKKKANGDKDKDKTNGDEDGERPPKRSKISWGRDG